MISKLRTFARRHIRVLRHVAAVLIFAVWIAFVLDQGPAILSGELASEVIALGEAHGNPTMYHSIFVVEGMFLYLGWGYAFAPYLFLDTE